MQISIRYFTTLREKTGKKEETLTYTNQTPTVELVLKTLSVKYGRPFTDYVFDTKGQVKNFLQLLINGANTNTLKGTKTILQEGDVLAILPPIGGG